MQEASLKPFEYPTRRVVAVIDERLFIKRVFAIASFKRAASNRSNALSRRWYNRLTVEPGFPIMAT
jgi:hypothetical protein